MFELPNIFLLKKGRVYRVHYSERGEKPEEVFVLLSQCEGWKQVEEGEREEDENRLKSKKKSKTTNWRVLDRMTEEPE